MVLVTRRLLPFMAGFLAQRIASLAAVPGLSLRGILTRGPGDKPAIEVEAHKLILLEGDQATMGVLNDERLGGADFEAIGHFNAPDRFEVDGIHERAMFVHKDGQRLLITYWCDVCYIRTLTPAVCVCCQKYTDLDLRESDEL